MLTKPIQVNFKPSPAQITTSATNSITHTQPLLDVFELLVVGCHRLQFIQPTIQNNNQPCSRFLLLDDLEWISIFEFKLTSNEQAWPSCGGLSSFAVHTTNDSNNNQPCSRFLFLSFLLLGGFWALWWLGRGAGRLYYSTCLSSRTRMLLLSAPSTR